MVNISSEAQDFFQSDASLLTAKRRQLKQANTLGNPRQLPSKILSAQPFASPLLANGSTPGSPLLLITDAGHMIRIVDAESGKSIATFKGHTGPVTSAVYMHDSAANDTFIFTGSWDKSIKKWSLATRECLATYALHRDFVKSLTLSPMRTHLASGSSDKSIRILDLATGSSRTLLGHTRGIEDLAFSPDAKYLWSGGSEGSIRKWDLETCTEVSTQVTGHHTSVYALWLDAEDDALWSASADHEVKRWTIVPGKEKEEMKLEHADYVTAVLPFGGGVVFTGSRDEGIRVWDVAAEKLIKVIDGHFDTVTALCIVGDTLYSCSLDGTLRSWKLQEVLDPKVEFKVEIKLDEDEVQQAPKAELTAEEEAELAELMSDDD
ncbi:WD40-repeat-containing domain protein [Catenaria anguillulae PL171]|uniref:WD40-repeat-containing domain protein n=1 Tax=Catenaria anguillulae PL171 TaxID=765915 RepID=A0A1Y2HWF4_9FUNG|nr:WD40-repeat-containing domain protein [Catenaria anguillulae PL171]